MKLWTWWYFWGWSYLTSAVTDLCIIVYYTLLRFLFIGSLIVSADYGSIWDAVFVFFPSFSPFFPLPPPLVLAAPNGTGVGPPGHPHGSERLIRLIRRGRGGERIYADLLNSKNVVHIKQNLFQKKAWEFTKFHIFALLRHLYQSSSYHHHMIIIIIILVSYLINLSWCSQN